MAPAIPAVDAGDEPLLRVRALSVHYGSVRALEGVDLDMRRGEVVALAGENGAGKSSLVRCIAGDIAPSAGTVNVNGRPVSPAPGAAARLGVAVVWQDLALCDNLDVASNLLLGRESARMMLSGTRLHARAASLLADLGIALADTTAPVGNLSGGQRQLVAVARAMRDRPQLLILDEPTAALGVAESIQVEELTAGLPAQGTSVLLVSHDLEQMFRLADRIVVLRHGRVVANVDPQLSHPDEVAALLTGQPTDVSARRQLSRLHVLADQLASAAPSSSLALILSALGAALGNDQLCIHVHEGGRLRMAGTLGLPSALALAWSDLAGGLSGGPVGRAVLAGHEAVSADVETSPGWARYRHAARRSGVRSSWSVPFTAPSGLSGVITVLCRTPGVPSRDELSIVTLYAGFVASALERDRLLNELTARNRVLETIREVLETLAGPVPLAGGLVLTLRSLRSGLGAEEMGIVTRQPGGAIVCRACVTADGESSRPSTELVDAASEALGDRHGPASYPSNGDAPYPPQRRPGSAGTYLAVQFPAPSGLTALVARWAGSGAEADQRALMEDAANSLRLALEREASERANQEAMALRRSQELQRRFLSSLSHELRTPLTAIRGYASSLMQPDVHWDEDSQRRFLSRISDESARLGRLVDDLLDFSAIDAGILRLHRDWCDVGLVLEAARACLPAPGPNQVELRSPADVPVIWADHDRLEQVFVNLLDNAIRHNRPGTRVVVEPRLLSDGCVEVAIVDDGDGIPTPATVPVTASGDLRSRTAGAGLGLSIARGIVDAHGGQLRVERGVTGTRCLVQLPVASTGAGPDGAGDG